MDGLKFHPLIDVTPEEVSMVRESLNMSPEEMEKNIDMVIEWWKKEEHLVGALPEPMERGFCERLIILSRGSVETCKRKIEKLLTTRSLFPEIALNKDYEEFEDFLDNAFMFPLQKTNPSDHTRVVLTHFMSEDYQNFNYLTFSRLEFLMAEFRSFFDYNFSDRYILDMKNCRLNMVLKINPTLVKKSEILIADVYGVRVKGIHIVNAPPFVDKVVNLLKRVFKEKIAKRIYVHNSFEELHEIIDKSILPEDYGGQLPSCQRIIEQWREYFKSEEAKLVRDLGNGLYSNETKRTEYQLNEEYLGTPGTFKQIHMD